MKWSRVGLSSLLLSGILIMSSSAMAAHSRYVTDAYAGHGYMGSLHGAHHARHVHCYRVYNKHHKYRTVCPAMASGRYVCTKAVTEISPIHRDTYCTQWKWKWRHHNWYRTYSYYK